MKALKYALAYPEGSSSVNYLENKLPFSKVPL